MNPLTPSSAPSYGQPFALSLPPRIRRNTNQNSASGGVQPASHHDNNASESSLTDTGDAIREGKQRAKDIMAASGIDMQSTPTSSAPSGDGDQANGVQMTRKRSRSGSRIPARASSAQGSSNNEYPPHDDVLLEQYIQRDLFFSAASADDIERNRELVRDKELMKNFYAHDGRAQRLQDSGAVFGYGYNGYGNGRTDSTRPMEWLVRYPKDRRRVGKRRAPELRVKRQDAAQQAEYHEELVPVRLDIEMEKLRLRDTFTWNLNERTVDPRLFAETLVEDLRIPVEASAQMSRQVEAEIKDQLQNYYPHVWPSGVPAEPDLPYGAHKNDDMRVMINLNITIGSITLQDKFEWDINNPMNSPEEFARQMALDLSLSGEFTTAIAHSIREQSQLYSKSLFLTNYEFDGRPIEDPDIRDNLLPTPLPAVFRPHQAQKDCAPFLWELSEADLEKTELSMLREQRAQKRQLNRRGGPALPDLKERQRTVRSLVVSSVIPGAAETMEASGIFKIRKSASRGRRVRADDATDSDDLEGDESGAESPAPSAINVGTTARTRNMRGAASAAQAAMRNVYGRSATPEISQLETRTFARRSGVHELREESVTEPSTLIVKLKIAPEKLKRLLNKQKNRPAAAPLSGFPTSQAMPSQAATQMAARENAMPPPSTPAMQNQSLPSAREGRASATPQPARLQQQPEETNTSARSTPAPSAAASQVRYNHQGRVDASVVPATEDLGVSPFQTL